MLTLGGFTKQHLHTLLAFNPNNLIWDTLFSKNKGLMCLYLYNTPCCSSVSGLIIISSGD